jgi:hypothetical protein
MSAAKVAVLPKSPEIDPEFALATLRTVVARLNSSRAKSLRSA